MLRLLVFLLGIGAVGTAQAATVDLTDNSFSSVSYVTYVPQGAVGPVNAFTETVNGVTFQITTTNSFYKVGTWGNGTNHVAGPFALDIGGGGGSAPSFNLSVSADVTLNGFWGHSGPAGLTNPVFDVFGSGVSSTGNTFSTSGFLGSATPVLNAFQGGALSLLAGSAYGFVVTNAGVVTQGFITGLEFSTAAPVPVPPGLPLLLGGLTALALMRRRTNKT